MAVAIAVLILSILSMVIRKMISSIIKRSSRTVICDVRFWKQILKVLIVAFLYNFELFRRSHCTHHISTILQWVMIRVSMIETQVREFIEKKAMRILWILIPKE